MIHATVPGYFGCLCVGRLELSVRLSFYSFEGFMLFAQDLSSLKDASRASLAFEATHSTLVKGCAAI